MSDQIASGDFQEQARVFKTLGSEVRLQLLDLVSKRQPVSAPELDDDIDITPESIKDNLNKLEEAGFLKSSRERGPGNRPRDEFVLAYDVGIQCQLEVVPEDYSFYLGEPPDVPI